MIGRLAPGGIALGLLAIGAGAVVAPRFSSGQYGIPIEAPEAAAYVRALGVRDLVIGLLVLRALARRDDAAVAAIVGFGSLIALGDFAIVLRERGPGPYLVVHAAGGVGMLVAWALARRFPGPPPLSE